MTERRPIVLVSGVLKELPSGDTLPGVLRSSGHTVCRLGPGNVTTPSDLQSWAFTSGGTYEILAGDVITGASSAKTATVWAIYRTSGTWAGGDAAGWAFIYGASGAFTSGENWNVGATNNVATGTSTPTANAYATPDFRGSVVSHDFQDTVPVASWYTGVLEGSYAGGGLTLQIHVTATTATTGTVGFLALIRRIGETQDVDVHSGWSTHQVVTAENVNGTSGIPTILSVAFTDGSQMDSLAAGEMFQLALIRDTPTDTASGDAEVLLIEVRET